MDLNGKLLSLLSLLLFGCIPYSWGDNVENSTDSVSGHVLDEFIVNGKSQYAIDGGIAFIPSSTEKKHSYDALSLIDNMSIPFLDVSNNSIKSLLSDNVTVYIDYKEATKEDLMGLLPKDVIRVEYLEYSSDPRFMGNRYVINFIMKHHESGGYVKAQAYESFLLNNGDYLLYAKLNNKRWTYDVSASKTFYRIQDDEVVEENYSGLSIPSGNELVSDVSRISKNSLHHKLDFNNIGLRLSYDGGNLRLSNYIRFCNSSEPSVGFKGTVAYLPDVYAGGTVSRTAYNNSNYPRWQGNLYYKINSKHTISTMASFTYAHTDDGSSYKVYEQDAIKSSIEENRYSPKLFVQYWGNFDDKNSLYVSLNGNFNIYSNDYSGNVYGSTHTNLKIGSETLTARYTHSFSKKLHLGLYLIAMNNWTKLDSQQTKSHWSPGGDLSLEYKPNDSHKLQFRYYQVQTPADDSYNTGTYTQENEIEWFTGTYGLKNKTEYWCSLTYTWLPVSAFGLVARTFVYKNTNCVGAYWKPWHDIYMLRSYNSDTDYTIYSGLLSATVSLFSKSLKISPYAFYQYNEYTGSQQFKKCVFFGGVTMKYFIKKFDITAVYKTPNKEFSPLQRSKIYSTYSLTANYVNKNFHISLKLNNFFGGKGDTEQWMDTEYYNFRERNTSYNNGFSFSVKVGYTFHFGKKVDTYNEMSTQSDNTTSILR